jgi:predicted  nucleic acid-binding Zn-ribbon protein
MAEHDPFAATFERPKSADPFADAFGGPDQVPEFIVKPVVREKKLLPAQKNDTIVPDSISADIWSQPVASTNVSTPNGVAITRANARKFVEQGVAWRNASRERAAEATRLEGRVSELAARIAHQQQWMETEGKADAAKLRATQEELATARGAAVQDAAKVNALQKAKDELTANIAKKNTEHAAEVAHLQELLRDQARAAEELATRMTTASLSEEGLKSELASSRAAGAEMTRQLINLRTTIDQMGVSAATQGSTFAEKVMQIAVLEGQLAKVRNAADDVSRLTNELDDVRGAHSRAEAAKITAEVELETLKARVAELEQLKERGDAMAQAEAEFFAGFKTLTRIFASPNPHMVSMAFKAISSTFDSVLLGKQSNDPSHVREATRKLAELVRLSQKMKEPIKPAMTASFTPRDAQTDSLKASSGESWDAASREPASMSTKEANDVAPLDLPVAPEGNAGVVALTHDAEVGNGAEPKVATTETRAPKRGLLASLRGTN